MEKKRLGKNRETVFELPMAPMIDVIFQLLIFFMCTMHFKSLEGKLSSHLPKDKGLISSEDLDPPMDEYRIRLVFDPSQPGHMTRIMIGRQEFDDWQDFYQTVAEYYQIDRRKNQDTPFKIDADEQVPFQSVVSALNACQEAGITNIEFTAKTPVNQAIQ